MHLHELQCQNLRNLRDVRVELDPGFNYIYGANGAGKTALLEAVHILARGRSFRAGRSAALIHREADALTLRAVLHRDELAPLSIAMHRSRDGATRLKIGDRTESRISEVARHLPVQLLLPAVADLVFGSPGERRTFLDWGLFHVKPGFLEVSRRYRRAVSQRNAWLKSGEAGAFADDPWFEQLLAHGMEVSASRMGYIEELADCFDEMLRALEPDLAVRLEYRDGGYANDRAEAAKKVSESFARDVKFGLTHNGPHRADVRFVMDDRLAAESVSRGQAKLIASAAVLGQALHLQRTLNQPSVILIDDFGAELDVEHWRCYVDVLQALECQVIATSTDEPGVAPLPNSMSARVFHVKHGVYRRSDEASRTNLRD